MAQIVVAQETPSSPSTDVQSQPDAATSPAQPAPQPQPVTEATPPPPAPEPEKVTEAVDEAVEKAASFTAQAWDYARSHILTEAVAIEVGVVVACGLVALALSPVTKTILARLWPAETGRRLQSTRRVIDDLVTPFLWVVALWAASAVLRNIEAENDIVRAAASLLNAWILIRLFSSLVADHFWSRIFASIAWLVAALNILRLLDPTIAFLDAIAIQFGNLRLSVYLVLKGLIFAGLLVWIATLLSRAINSRITQATALTPSVRTLIGQSVQLGLLFLAVMIALGAIGVDLTAMAVFSGAVGVGIGFGLQSVFSNLVAGIILLLERSIKVGDFVELSDGIQGTVREITIRSTLVTTNDNIDVLVPNSEFITKQLTNWTMRDAYRRIRVPFGVAYGSDKDLVKKAGLEAAEAVKHTLREKDARAPQIWLVGFGDSSLDFELVVWLGPDSVTRPAAVSAAYYWELETALRKYDIEIPFPQRDLHIRSGQLPVELSDRQKTAD